MSSGYATYWRNEKYCGGFCLIQSIERGASGELVAAIIATYPDSVKQKDGKGRLPLVVAIESRSEYAVIDSLVAAFPGALKLPYLRKLPIHMAVEVGACVRSIRVMVGAYPDGLRCRYYGRLPLHMLLEAQGPSTRLSVVLALLEASPTSLSQHFIGKSPLFIAIEEGASPSVVKALNDSNPRGFKSYDTNKRFMRKLHEALDEASDPDLIALMEQEVTADELNGGNGYPGSVLHEGLALNPPNVADLVDGLLKLDMGLVSARDTRNRLPLRVAMEAGCPAKVVGNLLAAYPQASTSDVGKSDSTRLPLIHLAVGFPPAEAFPLTDLVLRNDPGCIWVRDGTGRLPLQRALEKTQDPSGELASLLWRKLWDRDPSLERIGRRQREGDQRPFFEMTPGEEMRAEAVRKLRRVLAPGREYPEGEQELIEIVKVCPDAVARHDEAGILPLHYALHGDTRPSDVELLVNMWPDCLVVADAAGWLPLHWALYRQAPQALVLWLLHQCPEAAMHGPNLPLHIALALNAQPGVIRGVIKAYPEAVQQAPTHGMPTIHWAMRRKMKAEVVLDLIDAFPAGAMLRDEEWELPLHRACTTDGYLLIVGKLLKVFPDALLSVDGRNRIPADRAPHKDSLVAKALRRARGAPGDYSGLQQIEDFQAQGRAPEVCRLRMVSQEASERNEQSPSISLPLEMQDAAPPAWNSDHLQGHQPAANSNMPQRALLHNVSSRKIQGPKLTPDLMNEVSVPSTPPWRMHKPPTPEPEPEPMPSTLDQFSQPGKWISPYSDMQLQRLLSDENHGEDGHLGDPYNGGWTASSASDGDWRPDAIAPAPVPVPAAPPPPSRWRPMSAVTVTEKNRHYTTTTHHPHPGAAPSRSQPVVRPQSARPASAQRNSDGISWGRRSKMSVEGCRHQQDQRHPRAGSLSSAGSYCAPSSGSGRPSSARRASEHPENALLSLRSANRHTMMSPYAQHALGQMISECGLDDVGMLPNGKPQSPDAFHIEAQQQYVKNFGNHGLFVPSCP